MQARPEGAGEARVAVRDKPEHVGQPMSRNTDEVARRRLGGGGLAVKAGTSHTRAAFKDHPPGARNDGTI